jgi:hypothetical protein
LRLQPHSLYFVVSGSGTLDGERWNRYSVTQLDFDERAVLQATEEAVVLHIGLPDLRAFVPAETRELALAGR